MSHTCDQSADDLFSLLEEQEELFYSPVCACKSSCLLSLRDDSIGRGIMVSLVADFRNLTHRERRTFMMAYQCVQSTSNALAYIFHGPDDSDSTDQVIITLCRKATAALFGISCAQQEKYHILISGVECTESCRQMRLSQLLLATATSLRSGPCHNKFGAVKEQTDWDNESFTVLKSKGDSKIALQSLIQKYMLNPWTRGHLTYAVKSHPPYKNLLKQLNGCHVILSDSLKRLFGHFESLGLPLPHSKWVRVHVASLHNSRLKKKSCILYQTLQSNTMLGTVTAHLKSKVQDLQTSIKEFDSCCQSAITSIAGEEGKVLAETYTGILWSPKHGIQNAHYDFKADVLTKDGSNMFLGFTPITPDGMFLQVWPGEGLGTVLYIPYGDLVILPSSTMHAGGFCSREKTGNLRLHFYFYLNNVKGQLSNKNVYHDSKGDFNTRFLNADALVNGSLSKLFANQER